VLGIIAGVLIGGVGIAAMGSAAGFSGLIVAVVLALVGAVIGSRVGLEFDRRDAARG
jgi:hypothetical protein